jgi:hypothetical protein
MHRRKRVGCGGTSLNREPEGTDPAQFPAYEPPDSAGQRSVTLLQSKGDIRNAQGVTQIHKEARDPLALCGHTKLLEQARLSDPAGRYADRVEDVTRDAT